jgi:hypothetical protein
VPDVLNQFQPTGRVLIALILMALASLLLTADRLVRLLRERQVSAPADARSHTADS